MAATRAEGAEQARATTRVQTAREAETSQSGAAEKRVNGLRLEPLQAFRTALESDPAAGRVTFRSRSRWQDGARVHTDVQGFRVDGEPLHAGSRRFVILVDEPAELGGTDAALAPAETLMSGIASCVIATTNAYASFLEVQLRRLEVELEGDVDLHGIFGLEPGTRSGFGTLRARTTIAGDADGETLRQIADLGWRYSPMRDSVEDGVPFTSEVEIA